MGRRPAVIVDMDGTLCEVSTVVHLQAEPDGFSAFHHGCAECPPNGAVVDCCVNHHSRGHAILIVTGRDAWARELTTQWLMKHLPVPIDGLYMRSPEIVGLWQQAGIPAAIVLDWGEVVIGSE